MYYYQIAIRKLDKSLDKYLIGKDLKHNLYIYHTYFILAFTIFRGPAKACIEFLSNEEYLNNVK